MRIFKLPVLILLALISFGSIAVLPTLANGEQSYVFTPIVPGDGTLRRIRVPILMYHYVSNPPDPLDTTRVNLSVSPDQFEAHLQYLQGQEYTGISLSEIDAALNNGAELPSKPIILSFDDGYLDHYTNAFPLLQRYNYVGTFFVITEFADRQHPAHLTWEHIDEMIQAGMSIQPHTKTHADLTSRDNDFLVYEILGSIESVAARTEQTPIGFAYPIGRYDDNTLRVIQSTPIQRAVTTQFGSYQTTDNRYEMPRIRISNDTTVAVLGALLKLEDT